MNSKIRLNLNSDKDYEFIPYNNELYYFSNDSIGIYKDGEQLIYSEINQQICLLNKLGCGLLFITFNNKEGKLCIGTIEREKVVSISDISLEGMGITETNDVVGVNNHYMVIQASDSTNSSLYLIVDMKNLKAIIIDRMNEFYEFKLHESTLIVCKSFEEDDERTDSLRNRSYICGFNISDLFAVNKNLTIMDLDEIVYSNLLSFDLLMINEDSKGAYSISCSEGSLLFVQNYLFKPGNYSVEECCYNLANKMEVINVCKEKTSQCNIQIANNTLFAIDREEGKLLNTNLNLIYQCDQQFDIAYILEVLKNTVYILCQNENTYIIDALNISTSCKNEIYREKYSDYNSNIHQLFEFNNHICLSKKSYKNDKIYYELLTIE